MWENDQHTGDPGTGITEPSRRRDYTAPRLTEHGKVAEVTRSGVGGQTDLLDTFAASVTVT